MVINKSKSYLKIADMTTKKSLQPVICDDIWLTDWQLLDFFEASIILNFEYYTQILSLQWKFHKNPNLYTVHYVKVFT